MRKPERTSTVLNLALMLSRCIFVSAQVDSSQIKGLERTIKRAPDHTSFDSSDFSASELAATAVSPFCKSFTFLCHVRCLQRGDPQNPGNFIVNESSPFSPQDPSHSEKVEINRCSLVPRSKSVRVLCLCSNGVDLTAEVDYALEGVVDIQAAGGDGSGTGEAGRIREVAYKSIFTKVVRKTVTQMATETATEAKTETKTETTTETTTVKESATAQVVTTTEFVTTTITSCTPTSTSLTTSLTMTEGAGGVTVTVTGIAESTITQTKTKTQGPEATNEASAPSKEEPNDNKTGSSGFFPEQSDSAAINDEGDEDDGESYDENESLGAQDGQEAPQQTFSINDMTPGRHVDDELNEDDGEYDADHGQESSEVGKEDGEQGLP
ncbi:hypothetical protein BGX28_000822 [Mortierella sp. GBA30]|nr:hypothetical protein BGX28_000822 [Mortierella sp. GBA30]